MSNHSARPLVAALVLAMGGAAVAAGAANRTAASAAGRTPVAAAATMPPSTLEPAAQLEQLNADSSTPLLKKGAKGVPVMRAQIMLDRVMFSPGEIDGSFGSNMTRAVAAFQLSRGLPANGEIGPETWAALQDGQAPAFALYTVTEQDMNAQFQTLPKDAMEQAKLEHLGYQSLLEAAGERFHMSPKLITQLNAGRAPAVGQQMVVTNIDAQGALPAGAVASLRIDKSDKVLYVLDASDKVLAAFPVSFGGPQDPLPEGRMKITSKALNPPFSYNPELLRTAKPTDTKVRLAPGPNNPVGLAWLGLSKPHWGIHGTNEPSQMARVETNGCVRLTNWDVLRLAAMIKPGVPVDVQS